MKAKEYLNQVKMLEDYMDRLSNEYFKMKELAMNPGGFDYSKERVQCRGRYYESYSWQIC